MSSDVKQSKSDDDFWKEDDFWNTSSTSTFNFDDDEDSLLSKPSTNEVFNPPLEENMITLPIHSIISKECLNLILDDIRSTYDYVVPSPKDTVQKMFYGFKFVLEIYKTIEDKLLLLDSAIETCDGNVIIMVILFLKKTLKVNIFLNHLTKRKVAVKHYASYLITKGNLQELADLYMATGLTSHMKDIYYLLCRENTNKESLLKKLNQFTVEYSNLLGSADDNWDIHENISFIAWQIENKEDSASVVEQMAQFYRKHQNIQNDASTLELKKQFKIDDFQFEWSVMNVLSMMERWDKLKITFIKPNRFLRNNTIKSVIRPDLLIDGISKHKPPPEVLEEFLQYVTDSERSLRLAQKLDLHRFIINLFIAQRDRLALISYRSKVASRPEELSTINVALQSQEKKWKN